MTVARPGEAGLCVIGATAAHRLFHGTLYRNMKPITESKYLRPGNNGMLGPGIYLGEDPLMVACYYGYLKGDYFVVLLVDRSIAVTKEFHHHYVGHARYCDGTTRVEVVGILAIHKSHFPPSVHDIESTIRYGMSRAAPRSASSPPAHGAPDGVIHPIPSSDSHDVAVRN